MPTVLVVSSWAPVVKARVGLLNHCARTHGRSQRWWPSVPLGDELRGFRQRGVRVIEGVGPAIMVIGGPFAFALYAQQVVARASVSYR